MDMECPKCKSLNTKLVRGSLFSNSPRDEALLDEMEKDGAFGSIRMGPYTLSCLDCGYVTEVRFN
jgi:hypothetical protein